MYQLFIGPKRCHTTAYHPSANGLVECFHRQSKAALKALDPSQWTDALPLMLLRTHTALKDDLSCSIAKLLYGTTLQLSSEFFNSSTPLPNPATRVTHLHTTMSNQRLFILHTLMNNLWSNLHA